MAIVVAVVAVVAAVVTAVAAVVVDAVAAVASVDIAVRTRFCLRFHILQQLNPSVCRLHKSNTVGSRSVRQGCGKSRITEVSVRRESRLSKHRQHDQHHVQSDDQRRDRDIDDVLGRTVHVLPHQRAVVRVTHQRNNRKWNADRQHDLADDQRFRRIVGEPQHHQRGYQRHHTARPHRRFDA